MKSKQVSSWQYWVFNILFNITCTTILMLAVKYTNDYTLVSLTGNNLIIKSLMKSWFWELPGYWYTCKHTHWFFFFFLSVNFFIVRILKICTISTTQLSWPIELRFYLNITIIVSTGILQHPYKNHANSSLPLLSQNKNNKWTTECSSHEMDCIHKHWLDLGPYALTARDHYG